MIYYILYTICKIHYIVHIKGLFGANCYTTLLQSLHFTVVPYSTTMAPPMSLPATNCMKIEIASCTFKIKNHDFIYVHV